MSLPAFEHGEDPFEHAFLDSLDGCVLSGWPCPECAHENSRSLYLKPPDAALVECLACRFEWIATL